MPDVVTRVYKPEITACPLCGHKLMYRYTVSNKIIQFTNGKNIRIKNLGYSCTNSECTHPGIIYTSQTASKLCIKGYTYSAKILALVAYYKMLHKSREEICDIFTLQGIEISDRNIDIIYEKYRQKLNMDYKKNIQIEYDYMNREFGQIMLSIDSIALPDDYRLISVRNFFTSSQIGLHLFKYVDESSFSMLDDYLNKELNITLIATVRPIGIVVPEIKKRVNDNTKFIYYLKY